MRAGVALLGQGQRSRMDWAQLFDFTVPMSSALAGTERSGLGGMWQSDGTLGFGPCNLFYASNFTTNWSLGGDATRATGKSDPDGGTSAVEISTAAGGSLNYLRQSTGFGGTVGGITHTVKFAAKSVSGEQTLGIDFGNGAQVTVELTTSWATYTVQVVSHATNLWVDFELVGAGGTYQLYYGRCARGMTAFDITTTAGARYLMRQEKHPLLSQSGVKGEPQRRNLALYTRQMELWAASGLTPVGAQAIAPNGLTEGAKLTQTTGISDSISIALSLTAGNTYPFSVFVKRNSGSPRVRVLIYDATLADSRGWIDLDFVTATPTLNATGGTGIVNYDFKHVGNDWWYVHVTATAGAGASHSALVQPDRTGSGGSIFVWGGQPEDDGSGGSAQYPSSLIHTYGSAQTRTTDPRLTWTLPAWLATALSTQGTLYVEFAFTGAGPGNTTRGITSISDGTSNNRIYVYGYSGSNSVAFYIKAGGSAQWFFTTAAGIPSMSAYTVYRLALTWSVDRVMAACNGVLIGTSSSITVPAGLTQFAMLGSESGDATTGGIVFRAGALTRVLSDSELQALAHA